MNELTPVIQPTGVEHYRASTNAAGLCKDIVVASAQNIGGRKYVRVEGWQAIAVAHGCVASSGDLKKTEEGGYSAVGTVRRMDTGDIIASAEGYVGPDEPTWFGGKSGSKTLPKRPDYAIRAMAQTRAISRACRSAFAHVVVLMNAGLETTPAEEMDSINTPQEPPKKDPAEERKKAEEAVSALIKKMGDATSIDELDEIWPLEKRNQKPKFKDLYEKAKAEFDAHMDAFLVIENEDEAKS